MPKKKSSNSKASQAGKDLRNSRLSKKKRSKAGHFLAELRKKIRRNKK
ncbi:hypothetical protein [Apilactobacillus sp. EABW-1NA]|nr:hypothetical protein [Apilactobacillus sp. EABW-1NA]MCT6859613.1 hypothetical protein [Apilactobacillus sp.]MDN2613329.1 hypothetical protein [Apilactobacillus sp. EABW-1NA]